MGWFEDFLRNWKITEFLNINFYANDVRQTEVLLNFIQFSEGIGDSISDLYLTGFY